MKRYLYAKLEDWINKVDELYYWAASYCKEHRCTVREFAKNNYTDILDIVERHGGF